MSIRFLLSIKLIFVLSSCSILGDSTSHEKWTNYGEGYFDSSDLQVGKSMVVFYRDKELSQTAVNIYINGDYHSSLLKDGFSSIILCSNSPFLISTSISSHSKEPNRFKGKYLPLPDKEISYIRISENKKSEYLEFEFISPEQANIDLKNMKYQTHVLSRTSKINCK